MVKLLLGLGNPGNDYAGTRHNLGFLVVDRIADKLTASWSVAARRKSMEASAHAGGDRIILAKPLTYMNLSGDAAVQVMHYYQVGTQDMLVICDDFALPLCKVRFRADGSCGGHNGLADVERALGTREFPRMRIGIGPARGASHDFVLGRFSKPEATAIGENLDHLAQAALDWAAVGTTAAMNRYNGETR